MSQGSGDPVRLALLRGRALSWMELLPWSVGSLPRFEDIEHTVFRLRDDGGRTLLNLLRKKVGYSARPFVINWRHPKGPYEMAWFAAHFDEIVWDVPGPVAVGFVHCVDGTDELCPVGVVYDGSDTLYLFRFP